MKSILIRVKHILRQIKLLRNFMGLTSSKIRTVSISKLGNPFHISHGLYFLIYSWRKNYEFGGFRNYHFGFFSYLKSFFKNKSVLHPDKLTEINDVPRFITEEFARYSNSDLLWSKSFLTLFPSNFGKKESENKLPQLLNLVNSAKKAGVSIYTFDSDTISDSKKFADIKAMQHEWLKIEESILTNSISAIIILGHKRSFCQENGLAIKKLKEKYNLKVLLYVTDNWNQEYIDMILNWEPFLDLIISYDYKIFESIPKIKINKVVVWPVFPQPVVQDLYLQSAPMTDLYFGGTCYLNRWVWSIFISMWKCINRVDVKLLFDFNLQPVNGVLKSSKTIAEYRNNYTGNRRVALHFLERHPGIFILTSSVWDSFSGGSLVLAQIGINSDPISSFFKRGTHYLAFTNLKELIDILVRIDKDPEWASGIAAKGHEFFVQNYTPNSSWRMLGEKLGF